ncbi:BON domain-containing protein [Amorphus sp. 3PC139-8]|uniref:BON domain-containing protein n=1 Tax=Amorphus sp. 3PC139-8 TaxID=2735676 RepID=UPI00345CCF9F
MFRWISAAVVTIVILLIVGSVGNKAETDAELAARVADRLVDEGIGWVETKVEGRRVEIVGGTASEDERSKAVRTIASIPGVAGVIDRTEVLPVAKPYEFTVTVAADGAQASGSLPNSAAVANISASLRATFGDNVDVSQLAAASGAPQDFRLAAEAAVSAAELLATGTVSVDATAVRISGTAKDSQAYDALTGGGAIAAPDGYQVVTDSVVQPATES